MKKIDKYIFFFIIWNHLQGGINYHGKLLELVEFAYNGKREKNLQIHLISIISMSTAPVKY